MPLKLEKVHQKTDESKEDHIKIRQSLVNIILHHVVFDFLKHVIIGHDEVLGRVTISDVSKDTQCLG